MIMRYVKEAGKTDQVDLRIGDALEVIQEVDEVLDLIFIDAHKSSYGAYFDLLWPKLRPGGMMLVDNTLWSGKVYQEKFTDKDTQGIRDLNDKIRHHPGLECILLPLRDGIMMVRKK